MEVVPKLKTPTINFVPLHNPKNSSSSSCSAIVYPSPNYTLQVEPPKQKLHLHSSISLLPIRPLHPQITTYTAISWRDKKRKKKKNKTKRFNPADTTTSDVLSLLDSLGLSIPIDVYTSLIQECTVYGDPQRAIELFCHISLSKVKRNLSLINRLLVMFVSCGLLEDARHMFDTMPMRDFNSWATLIVAYFEDADYDEVINLFLSMLNQVGMLEFPKWVMVCLLKACAFSMNFGLGKQVHGWSIKLGICDNVLLTCSLIRFYGKFKCFEDANIAFKQAARHNKLTWTAKIINDCREEQFSDALNNFKEMGRKGIKKNSFTFSSVLKACGRMPDYGLSGKQVHANAIKMGLVWDSYVQCSLVDMYGRSGLLRDAKQVLEITHNDNNNNANDACWNAMLMSYLQHGLYVEAIKLLYQMKAAGIEPQESLLNEVRLACGSFAYGSMN